MLTRLLETGPQRHAAAAGADLAQIYARREHDANLRAAKRVLGRCARGCTEPELRRELECLLAMLRRWPEEAVDALAAWRSSFVATVPGLLAGQIPRSA